MALTIKNPEVERLAEEVARLSGQNKTQAVRQALEEKRDRLTLRVSRAALRPTWPWCRSRSSKGVSRPRADRRTGVARPGAGAWPT